MCQIFVAVHFLEDAEIMINHVDHQMELLIAGGGGIFSFFFFVHLQERVNRK